MSEFRFTIGTTRLADAGVGTRDIAAVLGHASLQSAEHYSRGADRTKRAASAIRLLEGTKRVRTL